MRVLDWFNVTPYSQKQSQIARGPAMHTEIGVPLLARLGFHETGIDESETPWITQELRFLGLEQIRGTAIILANCEEHKKTARQIPKFWFPKRNHLRIERKTTRIFHGHCRPKKENRFEILIYHLIILLTIIFLPVFPFWREFFQKSSLMLILWEKFFRKYFGCIYIYISDIDTNVYAKCICE